MKLIFTRNALPNGAFAVNYCCKTLMQNVIEGTCTCSEIPTLFKRKLTLVFCWQVSNTNIRGGLRFSNLNLSDGA